MASKLHFSPISTFQRLSPGPGSPTKEEGITDLVQGIFHDINERLTQAGVPKTFIDTVVFFKHQEQSPRPLLPSIFEDSMMPELSATEKAYFLEILQEHSSHGTLFLFSIFGMRMLRDFNEMEKELGRSVVKMDKELFFIMFWKTFAFFLAKKEVVRWMEQPDAAKFRHFKILQSPHFLNPKKYALQLTEAVAELKTIKKPSPSKERLIKDIQILCKFLNTPGDGQEILSVYEPASFRECLPIEDSLEGCIPILEFACQMNRIIKRNDRFRDIRGEESLEIMESIMNEIDSKLKIIKLEKGKKSSLFFKSKKEEIYRIFIRSCLKTTEHSMSCNRQIAGYLKQRAELSEEDVASILYQNIFIHTSHFWIQHIRAALETEHNIPVMRLISRIRLILCITVLSKSLNVLTIDTKCPAPLIQLAREMQNIKLLNLPTLRGRDLIQSLNYVEEHLVDLDHVAALLNQEMIIIGGEEEQQEQEEPTGKTRVAFSRISQYIHILGNARDLFDSAGFERALEKIYEETLKVCESLKGTIPPKELQEWIRELYFSALQKQCYEYLLYKDFNWLLSGENNTNDDIFPQALLNLVLFEVPGAHEEEERMPSPSDLSDAVSLLSVSEPEIDRQFSPVSFKEEEVFEELEETPPIKCPAPSPVKKRATPEIFKLPKLAAKSASRESPSLEDFKKAKKFRQISKLLEMMKMRIIRTRGSHAIFASESGAKVVVPTHGEYQMGLIKSIYDQATQNPLA